MTDSHAESTVTQPAPTEQPERLDLLSHDIVSDKQAEIVRLFPEVRTEGGKIDFDRLKLVLAETVDPGKERYGMNWPGKVDCFKAIQSPSLGTLLPCREESIDFDATGNMIIEGDSLEVLKLMQKAYLGKIKTICIDPPYNTGNDFIYPDNYSETLQTYLEYTGQVGSGGQKFSTNTEADGRFHSKWMNMMYPRLYLAKNLLRDDGLIFISIDDTEVDNLKKLCNEIFGEENFLEQLVWKNKYNAGALTKGFSNVHEYILCYSKAPVENILAPLTDEAIAEYKGRDDKYAKRGGFVTQPLATGSKAPRPNLRFPIKWKGQEIWPEKQWLWSKERVQAALDNNEIVVNETDGTLNVRVKQYLRDEAGQMRKAKPVSILIGPYNQEGSKEVDELLGKDVFDFPKPSALIRYLLSLSQTEGVDNTGIVLDFMAGSGTTGHAVLSLNSTDGGSRKFILVQLPERTGRSDFSTIAEITKERIRRVVKKMNAEAQGSLDLQERAKQDRGFRVFRLSTSCFKAWQSPQAASSRTDAGEAALAKQLELHIEHILPGRQAEDLLFELLLKSGFPLTTKVETVVMEGKTVYSVSGGEMLICLEKSLSTQLIKAIADRKPWRVICLDEGFAGNDQLKTNTVQIMKSKGVTSFRTI
jgi:adenine-specific DNA-methyltransferase